MKLILNKTERQKMTLMGGVPVFNMTAKVQLEPGELEAIMHFRLRDCLVYKGDENMAGVKQFVSDNAANNPLWRLLPKPPIAQVTGGQLIDGITYEQDTLLGLIFLEGEVKKAADAFYRIVERAQTFMGEEALDLPLP